MNRQSVLISKKPFLVLILLVFLLGLALRAVEVLSGDFVFLFDQGRDYLAVREIVLNRKLTLIGAPAGGLPGVFHGPLWYFLLAIFYIFWQGNPYGGQVLMLILGLVTLLLMFLVGKKTFNLKIGLIALFLTAVSGPVMSQATMIWNPYPVMPLVVASFYFFYCYFLSRKPIYLTAGFFLIALMYNFEGTVSMATLLYSCLFLILVDRKINLKGFLYIIDALLAGYSPAILFELRHQFLQVRTILRFFFGGGSSLSSPSLGLAVQKKHLGSFYYHLQSTFNFLPQPVFWLLLIITIFASLWLLRGKQLSKAQKIIFKYFLLFPLANFLFYVFFPNTVWQWYLSNLYLVYIMIVSITSYFLIQKYKIFRIFYLIILFLMVVTFSKMLKGRYSHDFFDPRGTAGIKSKIQVIDYIYNDARGENFNLLVFTPPIYDYPYRYLFSWYGQKKYGYVPGEEKKGLFYLLIEPDSRKPWTYQGWLETVIKTGKILKEEKLSSGFIIQKRYEGK